LKLFVDIIDAKLFEAIALKDLKAIDIQHSNTEQSLDKTSSEQTKKGKEGPSTRWLQQSMDLKQH
jgi:hypothetical protein